MLGAVAHSIDMNLKFRKRLLINNCNSATLAEEYRLTNILLSSRLSHHNKSPMLWNYHQYIVSLRVRRAHSDIADRDRVRFIEDLCKLELQTVFASAKHHFMNYYAWDNARWIFQTLYSPLLYSPSARYYSTVYIRKFLENIVSKVKKWCQAHASDSSAWSYFQWILFFYVDNSFRESSADLPTSRKLDNSLLLQCVTDTIKFATTISLPHESVWCFLRRIISDSRYISERRKSAYIELISSYLKSRKNDRYPVGESYSKDISVLEEQSRTLSEYRDKEICIIEGSINWISVVRHLKG